MSGWKMEGVMVQKKRGDEKDRMGGEECEKVM